MEPSGCFLRRAPVGTVPLTIHTALGGKLRKRNLAVLCLIPTVGIIALVGANQSVPELSAGQIIPSLNQEQRAVDKIPEDVLAMFTARGGNPSETRFLGETSSTSYYGGPAGDEMCMAIIGAGEEYGVACTSMTGMAAAGLRIGATEGPEEVWLTPVESVPEGLERALEEQDDAESRASSSTTASEPEAVWEEQSPHFYVKTTSGDEK